MTWNTDETTQQETQPQTSGCTALGCFKEKEYPALLGQNFDLPERVKNNAVLLHLKEENGHESYILTFPGTIGQIGLNNSPLGLVLNLNHLKVQNVQMQKYYEF